MSKFLSAPDCPVPNSSPKQIQDYLTALEDHLRKVQKTDEFNEVFSRWGMPLVEPASVGSYGPILVNLELMSKKMEELQAIALNKIITE